MLFPSTIEENSDAFFVHIRDSFAVASHNGVQMAQMSADESKPYRRTP